jgi:hypothetical protein
VPKQVLSNSASVESNADRSEHSRVRIRSGPGGRQEIRQPGSAGSATAMAPAEMSGAEAAYRYKLP